MDEIERLIEQLRDEDWEVRSSAIKALYSIDGPAVEPLIELLWTETDPHVRSSAAEVLGEIGDARAIEPLIDLMWSETDEDVLSAVTNALCAIGEPAVEPLLRLLGDDNWRVRSSAAEVLGEIGDPRAVEPLLELARNSYDNVCLFARNALEEIRKTLK